MALRSPTDVGFGESVIIPCVVEGNPDPTVRWTHNASETLPSNVYQINMDLYINGAVFDNRGMYQCTASNIHGSDSSNTDVRVHGTKNGMMYMLELHCY